MITLQCKKLQKIGKNRGHQKLQSLMHTQIFDNFGSDMETIFQYKLTLLILQLT